MVNISGLSKAKVLAALYNASKPLGISMGFLKYDPYDMSEEEAQSILDGGHLRFDYVKGRVMKVSLENDDIYPGFYDRDNGQGALERVVNGLRQRADS